MLAQAGPPWNSLRACSAPFGQPRRVSSRGMRAPTRMRPACAPLLGTGRREPERPTRAVAALGLALAALRACAIAEHTHAAPQGPSAAMARADSQRPSVCAEEHRARGGRGCRRTHPLRDLTRRGCPSEARQRAASSTAPPRDRAPQVARSAAEGRRQQGRLSFGYFSLAKQRKAPRPPGRDPAPRSNHPALFKMIATSAYQISARSQFDPKRKPQASFLLPTTPWTSTSPPSPPTSATS
ncbi:hypothetical protein QE399_003984 [Paracidovorax wautersii]|uniref:Uncharacterized protein n=1 Tax=Paracidovorax wautersii TaxID=1177982 RepID=A0ABU1IGF0_9BURK|nr:hypothetical protein [Paracidovorax wautersii]